MWHELSKEWPAPGSLVVFAREILFESKRASDMELAKEWQMSYDELAKEVSEWPDVPPGQSISRWQYSSVQTIQENYIPTVEPWTHWMYWVGAPDGTNNPPV